MRNFCLIVMLSGLAGCFAAPELPEEPAFEPEPVPLFEPDNIGPWCGYAPRVGLNPDTDPATKKEIEDLAAARGC